MSEKFNWDDYELSSEKEESSFEWDKFEADESSETPQEMSTTGAFLRGAADLGTLGFRDELVGGVAAGAKALTGQLGDQSLGEAYRESRDEVRAASQQAQEESPWAYGTGALAGGVASSLGGGLAMRGLGALAKLGTGARTVAQAGMEGAVLGAGSSEAELTDTDKLPENLVDTAKEVGGTALASAGGGLVGVGIGKIARGIGDLVPAQKFKKAFSEGLEGTKLFGSSAREGQSEAIRKTGESINKVLPKVKNDIGKQIDAVWTNPAFHKSLDGNPATVALTDVAEESFQRLKNSVNLSPDQKSNLVAVLEPLLGDAPLTAKQFRMLDKSVRDTLNSSSDAPTRQFLTQLRSEMLERGKTNLLNPDAQTTLNTLNNKYVNILRADDVLRTGDSSSDVVGAVDQFLKQSDVGGTSRKVQQQYMDTLKNLQTADPKVGSAIANRLNKLQQKEKLLSATKYDPHGLKDIGAIGTAATMSGNLAGLATPKWVVNTSKAIGNTPPAMLSAMASRASTKYPSIATALNELASTPATKQVERAARLYSLHQLPEWRRFLIEEEGNK
jgi:hypothetical protein